MTRANGVPAGPAPSSWLERAARTARVIHPFPTLLTTAATVALCFVASKGWPDAWVASRLAAAMFCAQSGIGVVNDIFDRDLDRASKPWKPVASGLLPLGVAGVLALLFVSAALAVAATVNTASCALVALGTACGLVYDARLKGTSLSVLPFMAAVPTLPIWVWVSLDGWQASLSWLIPLGGLIGLAVHLANTAPDIEADSAAGVRGLAHWLGVRMSLIVAWCSFGAALLLSVALAPGLAYDYRWYAPALAMGGVAAAAGAYLTLRDLRAAATLSFPLIGIAAAAASIGWLGAVT